MQFFAATLLTLTLLITSLDPTYASIENLNIKVESVIESVVFVESVFEEIENGYNTEPKMAFGTGFIVRKDGYIITNHHVIDGATTINVYLKDGIKLKATLVGVDEKVDLAVLKIRPFREFTISVFGDNEKIKSGDDVFAIGHPIGLAYSVTEGIISNTRRFSPNMYTYTLQTDAAINKGNSGGPLYNEDGEVVGVNTMIISRSGGSNGLGLALPSNVLQPIIKRIINNEPNIHGRIGINVDNYQLIDNDLTIPYGVEIIDMPEGSPAINSGLRVGDIITTINGVRIKYVQELIFNVANAQKDDIIIVTGIHIDQSTFTYRIKLAGS